MAEPIQNVFHPRNAVQRFAGARKFVAFAGETHETHGFVQHFQRGVQLFGLFHRTAVIVVGVDNQQWRIDLVHIANRRAFDETIQISPRFAAKLVLAEVWANVGGAKETAQVGNAALGVGGGETVGVADDPVGHIAAV